jgi:hypothetical protein
VIDDRHPIHPHPLSNDSPLPSPLLQAKLEKLRQKQLDRQERHKEWLLEKQRKYEEKVRRMKEEAYRKRVETINVSTIAA